MLFALLDKENTVTPLLLHISDDDDLLLLQYSKDIQKAFKG